MGKRKERRLAAMIAAGRRVKLDLFAEPPGDSDGSSAQDGLGGNMDPRHHAGSPNSPSSSGKQPENPLLLLGQYSDDELEEESSKSPDHATADNDEQVKGPVGTENEDMENNPSMDLDARNDKSHDLERGSISPQNQENLDNREIDSAVTGDSCKEVLSMEETSVPGTSDVQLTGNLISSWKVVLHEESNQYYYWNTVTGETSWVVPDLLAQGTELTGEQKTAPDTEGRDSALSGANGPSSGLQLDGSITMHAVDHCKADKAIHETQGIYEPEACMEEQSHGNKDNHLEDESWDPVANQTEAKISSFAATDADFEKYICNPVVHEEDDIENELSSSALKHGEYLLDRLESLNGSESHMQGQDWISKYTWEVEIRLSDMKSLLPFGSSLLPFWVHCERKLKELEVTIDKEVSQFLNYVQIRDDESPHKSPESKENEIEADGNEKKVVCNAFENSHASADDVKLTVVRKDSQNETADINVLHAEHGYAIDYSTADSDCGIGGNSGVYEAAQPDELTTRTALCAGEDVDMDVDMEVEDTAPASAAVTRDSLPAECCAPEEQPIQPIPPAEHEPEAFIVPPPPDDDWIPPPPPDNELVPPPPPDDPHEPLYPPPLTYFETVQPLTYTEQYNLAYPGSNFEYYGTANTQFPTDNVYGQTEGCQAAVLNPPLYYESLPGTYPAAVPVVVSPVESVAYYDHQDGSVLPGAVASGGQSSGLHRESSYETCGSDQIRSLESHAEASCTLLSNTEDGGYAVNDGTEKASIEVPFTMATIQAPATVSVGATAPGTSTTAVAVAVATKSTASNAQSKVLRSKKRTVAAVSTLKSNKKVSSLVDKWKAAKEELHEDEEDEPENAYEILEKKRQREIEEWRAQQIASGDARANANFQPLGGDWRERVKRKRAQFNGETVQTSSGSLTNGNQQQLDLNELSKDLPSGWQAYWDESTKQVYYGNAITSETTWTRPPK
ncbi:Formin-binding protein [Actinidia chinensis var. chinensis]|uniref:Formin-binding protein n=1 Tax=Actinidia chinensis var. chinensis TaxID=1590841 RepID=A0A2R6PQD0_ACTCC|nr:Formin-binding protein [Actinidia chinensis var. chinensis]